MDGFRQELSHPGGGLSSYPHPRLMPDFWEFPTVSMGLGPLNAIYQARFNKYLHGRGIKDTSEQRVWAFLGDGEMDEVESRRRPRPRRARGARQPHLRRQLQPAAARRTGARQRQDHPGARVVLPRRRLERHQGDLGPQVGPPARAGHRRRAREPDEPHARRRLPDLQGRERRLRPRALLRPRPAHPQAGRALERRRGLVAAPRGARLPEALRRLPRGHRAQGPADGHPREDHQGLDPRQPLRGPQRHAPDEEAHPAGPQGVPRHACRSRSRTRSSTRSSPPYFHPGMEHEHTEYMHERRRALGGGIPSRTVTAKPLVLPGDPSTTS